MKKSGCNVRGGGVLQQALNQEQVGVYNHGRAWVRAEMLVDVHAHNVTKKHRGRHALKT